MKIFCLKKWETVHFVHLSAVQDRCVHFYCWLVFKILLGQKSFVYFGSSFVTYLCIVIVTQASIFCELCNWEIRTISDLIRIHLHTATVSPAGRRSILWLVQIKKACGSRRPASDFIGWCHANQTVAWWSASSLSNARSGYWSCLLQWKSPRRWVEISAHFHHIYQPLPEWVVYSTAVNMLSSNLYSLS